MEERRSSLQAIAVVKTHRRTRVRDEMESVETLFIETERETREKRLDRGVA